MGFLRDHQYSQLFRFAKERRKLCLGRKKGGSMPETILNIGWAVVFMLMGGVVGMALVLISSLIVPRVIEKHTPRIDEQKEILRGNTAVAEYFGRIVSAAILGVSIVVAAAVVGGVIAALH
jgi:hypothetical protein